ncbi:hypothetical protein [Modestobacter sp. SYSU DS0875]
MAAGLERWLAPVLSAGSLLLRVAARGLLLVSVDLLLGCALDTEFVFVVSTEDAVVPENAVLSAVRVATVPWLWLGAGVTGVALAVAALRHGALRHGALPRRQGWVGLLLGGLTLLLGISPLRTWPAWSGRC